MLETSMENLYYNCTKNVYINLPVAKLIEHAIKNNEAILTDTGALSVKTGKYTGRLPQDRYFVKTKDTIDTIDWENNNFIEIKDFENLRKKQAKYLQKKDIYVFDGYIGTDKKRQMKVRVINELAWQNLFVHQLLVRASEEDLKDFSPDFLMICTPNFKAEPKIDNTNSDAFICIDLEEKIILIGGTHYAGEMKKACFTSVNYFMLDIDVCPMHCSANIGKNEDVALFFGLSGTGKTTLSADNKRFLIGDDEHAWSDDGIFNFEGGCYAKTINLSQKKEPQIYNAIKFGSIIENVIVDEKTRTTDYYNNILTENTRAAYPIEYIKNISKDTIHTHPSTIIFLTADAFGVLPPISILDDFQAIYHYLSGYTSKLAGTENAVTIPQTTFSAGFGQAFFPRRIQEYAEIFHKKIKINKTQVYLINTGWIGGTYNSGARIKLEYTRKMVNFALNGDLKNIDTIKQDIFNLKFPKEIEGIPKNILNPKNMWINKKDYEKTATELAKMFIKNFKKYKTISQDIINSGPSI